MHRNIIETVLGAVVLVVAGFFLFVAYTSSKVRSVGGYVVEARFTSTGGLQTGADVRISGVKIGTVTAQTLDRQSFQAVLMLEIDPGIQLPDDTSAAVASESLLGGRFIDLQPGGSADILPPGGRIQFTQSAVNLEELLGRFIFSAGGDSKSSGAATSPVNPGANPAANPGAIPGTTNGGLLAPTVK
jgi:phospholipid/cholesterol/gamma-HCH transport system substrate-binding protein